MSRTAAALFWLGSKTQIVCLTVWHLSFLVAVLIFSSMGLDPFFVPSCICWSGDVRVIFLLFGGMPSHCIDASTRIFPHNHLHAHHGAACAGHGMSKLVRWPGRLALASVPHHNVIVASEEERGEVDTYMILSSYYYDMLTINNMTRHTTQKKTDIA